MLVRMCRNWNSRCQWERSDAATVENSLVVPQMVKQSYPQFYSQVYTLEMGRFPISLRTCEGDRGPLSVGEDRLLESGNALPLPG